MVSEKTRRTNLKDDQYRQLYFSDEDTKKTYQINYSHENK